MSFARKGCEGFHLNCVYSCVYVRYQTKFHIKRLDKESLKYKENYNSNRDF